MNKKSNVAIWVGRVLLAVLFVVTGASKLSGVPAMVDMFDRIGYGQGFRYVTGISEVLAAGLILWPRTSLYGAVWAACIVVGAFFIQLLVLHGDVVHTIVIGVVVAAMIWAQRRRIPV